MQCCPTAQCDLACEECDLAKQLPGGDKPAVPACAAPQRSRFTLCALPAGGAERSSDCPLLAPLVNIRWEHNTKVVRCIAEGALVAAMNGCGAVVCQRYVFWVLPCAVEVAHHLTRTIHLRVACMSSGQPTSSVHEAKPHVCMQVRSQDQTVGVACMSAQHPMQCVCNGHSRRSTPASLFLFPPHSPP